MEQSSALRLPLYQSHKVVRAAKIIAVETQDTGQGTLTLEVPAEVTTHIQCHVTSAYLQKHQPQVGGFYVLYNDGYESFSPAEAFEEGYRPVPTIDSPLTVAQTVPEPRDLRSFDQDTIDNWFTYHAPTPEQVIQYREVRTAAKIFAETINRHVPGGADKTTAIRKVREATMTANAGIACA